MGLREAARVLVDAGEFAGRVRALGLYLVTLRGVNRARLEADAARRALEASREFRALEAARDSLERWNVLFAQAARELALERDAHERRDNAW